ncbi:MAG: hypothetical protein WCD18_16240 [Thermosynechococcaceae cyanobacterium]
MQTQSSPPETENAQDVQLHEYQTLIQRLGDLSGEVSELSGILDSRLHDFKNQIAQQGQEIRSLKAALPDPFPIIDVDPGFSETPLALREQPQNPPKQIEQPTNPNPKTEGNADLQVLTQCIKAIANDIRSLPPQLERGILASLYSTFNPKPLILWCVGGAIAHSLLTAGLVFALLHVWPAPLNQHNEGQLYQIYKKLQ